MQLRKGDWVLVRGTSEQELGSGCTIPQMKKLIGRVTKIKSIVSPGVIQIEADEIGFWWLPDWLLKLDFTDEDMRKLLKLNPDL